MITLGPTEELKQLYLVGVDLANSSICEHCEFNITEGEETTDVLDHFKVIARKIASLAKKRPVVVSLAWETSKRLLGRADIPFV